MNIKAFQCTFTKNSLSGSPSITVRSSSASSSIYLGLLQAGNCVNGVFYCDREARDSTGRKPEDTGYYKLISPEKYGLRLSTDPNTGKPRDMFVDLNTAYRQTKTVTTMLEMTVNTDNIESIDEKSYSITSAASDREQGVLSESRKSASTTGTTDRVVSAGKTALINLKQYVNDKNETGTASINDDVKNAMKYINRLTNTAIGTVTTSGIDNKSYLDIVNNTLQQFNKFKTPFPSMHFARGIPYVFFTRPDLNFYADNQSNTGPLKLLDNLTVDPIINGFYNTDPLLLKSLTLQLSKSHTFNPFLSNMALSFDLSDESIETSATGDTFTGWRVKYGRHNIGYKSSGSFSIAYEDTQNLQIYKIHKAWVEYISKVYRGEIMSKDRYIEERRLDYACSVYYFLCAPDGETILYWSKYVGVFPTSVPTGNLGWNKGSIVNSPDYTINYDYSWKSDMELPILEDFNHNAGLGDASDISNIEFSPSYDKEFLSGGYTFANTPFIQSSIEDNKYVFRLKFRK